MKKIKKKNYNTAKNASVDFAAVLTGTTTAEEIKPFPHIYIKVPFWCQAPLFVIPWTNSK